MFQATQDLSYNALQARLKELTAVWLEFLEDLELLVDTEDDLALELLLTSVAQAALHVLAHCPLESFETWRALLQLGTELRLIKRVLELGKLFDLCFSLLGQL